MRLKGLGKNLVLAVGLTLTLTACGKKEKLEVGQFAAYVQKFEAYSQSVGTPTQVTDLVVQFGVLSNSRQLAVCEIYDDETPTITVSEADWNISTEEQKESLMLHEMGHCVLRRQHKSEYNPEINAPDSLMNPYVVQPNDFIPFKDYYISELFSKRDEI